jgi:hypothetical protein
MAQNLTGRIEIYDPKQGMPGGGLLNFWIHAQVMIFQSHLPPV